VTFNLTSELIPLNPGHLHVFVRKVVMHLVAVLVALAKVQNLLRLNQIVYVVLD
jgi:hypothetical protein